MLAEVTGDHVRSTVCLPWTLRPEAVSVIPLGVGVGVGVTVGVGLGVGVTVGVGVGVGGGVGVGVGVGVTVGVGVGVAVGVAVGVGVGLAVGVGVGVPPWPGAWISTVRGDPVLKKPTVALAVCGAWSASNRKLYNVPKRMALAF
jgi:hypothetical protein